LRNFAIVAYGRRTPSTASAAPKIATYSIAGPRCIIDIASPMPARSAAMLIAFASSSAIASTAPTQRGSLRRIAEPRPAPETRPTRAQVICTHAISGHVANADQRNALPNCAPTTE
jgi:hypothetical protein